jgi:hypothetical protein
MSTARAAVACLAAIVLAPAALAAGPFDGTWKTRLDSVQSDSKPDVYALKDGIFRCGNCAPPFSVKADGTDQKVSGNGYYDTVAVKIVDPHTLQITDKLAGKPMYEMRLAVSADGKTLNELIKDLSGAQAATWYQVASRVAPGAAGSHAVAGAWRLRKVPGASEVGTVITYRMTADGLQMRYNGATYDARFDGKPVLIASDPGRTSVALKRISEREIEETDTRGGAVTDVIGLTVSADGRTLSVVDRNRGSGQTLSWIMDKLP